MRFAAPHHYSTTVASCGGRSLSFDLRCLLRAVALIAMMASRISAETANDIALKLTATSATASPYITIQVKTDSLTPAIASQTVYRRLKGAVNWGASIGTIPVPVAVGTQVWSDTTASPGIEYEYWVKRSFVNGAVMAVNNPAIGYLMAASDLPAVESRGTILLVTESGVANSLPRELDQLRRDLVADGWSTQTISVSVTDPVASVKALIKAAYNADPNAVKAVFLIGHVPVPYSGDTTTYVDGHSPGTAHEADGYYGDMDGTWTDATVNCAASNGYAGNAPGDGKFDQALLPSAVELMVGRVDMSNLSLCPDASHSEADLTRRYLSKLHAYKFRSGPYANIVSQASIMNTWFNQAGKLIDLSTYSWANTCTALGWGGSSNVTNEPLADGRTFLIGSQAYLGSAYPVMNPFALGAVPYRAIFFTQYASFQSYWDAADAPLRIALAGNADGDSLGTPTNLIVSAMTHGRNHWFMHSMATGNPIGYAVRMSMNSQMTAFSNPVYQAHCTNASVATPGGPGSNGTTINFGLMGDPTLRIAMPFPPRNVRANCANGQVVLAWSASGETGMLGYHVYRAASATGPFARLTMSPVSGTSYTDATVAVGASYTYLVRTLKSEMSPGGTYQNLSIGEMVDVVVSADVTPASPGAVAVARSGGSAVLTWTDNATTETGYRIERAIGPAGTFSAVATLSANATTWTDPVPAWPSMSYYRVIAFNAAGDSASSGIVSFENRRGSIYFPPDSTSKPTQFKLTDVAPAAAGTNGGPRCTNYIVSRSSPYVPVIRSGGSHGSATIQYSTSAGSDVMVSGMLSWADGEGGIKYIALPVPSLSDPQHPLQVHIDLGGATGAGLSNVLFQASCLIIDPSAPVLSGWSEANTSRRSVVPCIIDNGTGSGISSSMTGGNNIATTTGWGAANTYESNGHFIYRSRSGDAVLQCYVPKALPEQAGGFYGVAVRGSTADNALCAATIVSPAGAAMMNRSTAGASSVYTAANAAFSPPCWIRIGRSGSAFTSSVSSDGTSWTVLGTVSITDSANMPSSACWGFVHSSEFNPGDYHVAKFERISLRPSTVNVASAMPIASEVPGYPGRFLVTLSDRQSTPTMVNYSISGTATNGLDYATLNGALTIPAGQISASIDVVPLDDSVSEADETVTLTLGSSADAVPGAMASATVTIRDKNATPAASVSAVNPVAWEGGGASGSYVITLSSPVAIDTLVRYAMSGEATYGGDYSLSSPGQITIPAGSTTASIALVVADDSVPESNERAIMSIQSGSGYTISGGSATIDMYDNDAAPLGSGRGITRERFDNLTNAYPASKILNLTTSAQYPSAPALTIVDQIFDIPQQAADNYGTRVHGYFIAPLTGNYTFYLCADDVGELWLSVLITQFPD